MTYNPKCRHGIPFSQKCIPCSVLWEEDVIEYCKRRIKKAEKKIRKLTGAGE